ncbi:hypothetical protein F5Y17DRAFT_460157 [Xylariaceae sp. FL0594]|nr:hypothetical protein F5Y17DRAFT_460157 [Xylariaceae sp. FL0594]
MTQQQAAKRQKPRKSRVEHVSQGQATPTQVAQPSQVAQPQQYQSPMTRSPFQSSAQVSARQAHRSQTNTPVATNARPPPKAQSINPLHATHSTSYGNTAATTPAPNYDPYPRYNNNGTDQYTEPDNGHSSSRATYETSGNAYQGNATTTAAASYSSTPSYDYGRGTAANNPLAQALSGATGYGAAANSSATGQWPTSQTRTAQNSSSPSPYGVSAAASSNTQSYNARASDGRSSAQNASYSQPQPQGYSSYSSQQPNVSHQVQQSWYGFPAAANNSNQTSYTNNRQSGYGNHRPTNAAAYSGQYGGNDSDQALYELLRNNVSSH